MSYWSAQRRSERWDGVRHPLPYLTLHAGLTLHIAIPHLLSCLWRSQALLL